MSLMQEVIEQYCQTEEKSETPRRPSTKSAKKGFDTFDTGSPERFDISNGSSVLSVDMLARELLQKRPDELRREAGDRWQWIGEDPDNLIAFANHEARRQIEESGNIPKEYDGTTRCRQCGPVPFHRGFERKVFNMCPWCFADQSPPPVSESDTRMTKENG